VALTRAPSTTQRVELADASAVGAARRTATALGTAVGMSELEVGRVAIVATELASNVVKHGGGGELLIQGAAREGVDLIALDRGRGIADLAASLRDGHSSSGTPGTGLGAIARLSQTFDIHSQPKLGTAVLARMHGGGAMAREWIGALNVPHPLETESGDGWSVRSGSRSTWVLVADGLGHGPHAASAAKEAQKAFESAPLASPRELLERIHIALRATRGAAVAIAEIDSSAAVVRFAGVGNVSGTIAAGDLTRSLVSRHGTAGAESVRAREFSYPWPPGSLLVLHSDGISARWDLGRYAGLFNRHPLLVAAVLYRDHRRAADDASIVVVRGEA
jgi:anti-sigma regulatory factor (Ser/Thr protein kinase)